MKVTLVQGRLSVDARDVDIQMILQCIGEQAGFSLNLILIGRRTISVQFTDTELIQGLRNLLQLASLSYAMEYAPSAERGGGLKKLWVFSGGEEAPRSHNENAAHSVGATTHDTQQLQQESSSPTNHFIEFFQRAQQQQEGWQTPQAAPTSQEVSPTLADAFVEFFQRAQ
jgi:hypothetical protein